MNQPDVPSSTEPLTASAPRILIAGIGNIFLGDDAFGCEVAQRLLHTPPDADVRVTDFGIRGMDLMYALGEGYDAAILIDAVPRNEPPGTLFLIEPDRAEFEVEQPGSPMLDAHSMDPLKVLRAAAALGPLPSRLYVLGCQPAPFPDDDMQMEISPPVRQAIDEAVKMVEQIVHRLRGGQWLTMESAPLNSSAANH